MIRAAARPQSARRAHAANFHNMQISVRAGDSVWIFRRVSLGARLHGWTNPRQRRKRNRPPFDPGSVGDARTRAHGSVRPRGQNQKLFSSKRRDVARRERILSHLAPSSPSPGPPPICNRLYFRSSKVYKVPK